ncbi:lipase 3-like [Cydia splendana]|uniref:lipase 3-like n=1 Tax=Cydia splendana TaxID=1100963 RepID=UPI00300CD7C8
MSTGSIVAVPTMCPLRPDGLLVLLLIASFNSGHRVTSSNKLNLNLNFTETATAYGYESEEHTVATEDGYLLKLFRITKGAKCMKPRRRTPVLLMHGLLLSADCWLDAGPDAGLAFLLSDSCFDTWVGNVRGTYYSREHLHLEPGKSRFWKFSVDEIGLYDIPGLIEYVLRNTGVKQLNYIGHSQGAGTFFIMCSERPGYCDKAKLMIALAPATRQFNTKSVVFRTVPLIIQDQKHFLQSLGIWELFARRLPTYEFFSNLCQNDQASSFCEWVLSMLDAPHSRSISRNTLKTLYKHVLAGTSTQNMARYGQSMLDPAFTKYNYGREKNIKLYGSDRPPEYDLRAVSVPVVLIYGKNDGIVDVKDVQWLKSKLPNVIESIPVKDKYWTHLDMAYSQNTNVMIFQDIRKYLLQYD